MSGAAVIIFTSDTAWNGLYAPSGSHFLGIQGIGSYINQTVFVPANTAVTVTYYAKSRPIDGHQTGLSGLALQFSNLFLVNQTLTYSWTQYTVTIPARSSSVTGSFIFRNRYDTCIGDCTFFLDNVILAGKCKGSSYLFL